MPALSTDECYAHTDRLSERVVLITGAGSGFGRELAVEFSKYGAYVVLGDVNETGLAQTAALVTNAGGMAITRKCDVTSWEDQVALFELGIKAFGNIDIVLPNAGVSEVGRFDPRQDGSPDKLTKPNMTTLDIDLTGVLYTARIALYHFVNDKRADPGLRAIAFTGSMSSFYGSDGVMYGAAKAGILGIQKGLIATGNDLNLRIATVCPYFSKTNILDKDFVHPNPSFGYAKIEDVVSAFIGSITDPDQKTNYGVYLIPDSKGVYRMEATQNFVGAEAARRPRAKKAAAKL